MPTTQTDQSQDPNATRIGRLVTTVAFNETVNAYLLTFYYTAATFNAAFQEN